MSVEVDVLKKHIAWDKQFSLEIRREIRNDRRRVVLLYWKQEVENTIDKGFDREMSLLLDCIDALLEACRAF